MSAGRKDAEPLTPTKDKRRKIHNAFWFEQIVVTALPSLFQARFSLECFLFRALHGICHYTNMLFIFTLLLWSGTCKGKKFISVSKIFIVEKTTSKQAKKPQKKTPAKPNPASGIKQQWFWFLQHCLLKIRTTTVSSRLNYYISLKEKNICLLWFLTSMHPQYKPLSITGINWLLLLGNCQKLRPKNVSKYLRPSSTQ